MNQQLIRNFSIIAHIDHGKSTLADRLLQATGTISERDFHDQMLDSMDLERERGITIKCSAVRIDYKVKDGSTYVLNLIDTPGHVDFTYEVSKSLAACEGALLLVDAGQGVEAQTVANLYLAMEHHLKIIPVINKIDLQNAEPDKIESQIRNILNLKTENVIRTSAKLGQGTADILEAIVREIPPPVGDASAPLQALVFDSAFDTYRGVIVYLRVKNGTIRRDSKIKMMGADKIYDIQEIGVFKPNMVKTDELAAGEVGYLICNIKEAKEVHVGDTVTDAQHPAAEPLPGYKKVQPMVFSGIYPVNAGDFPALKDAVEKLRLSDASFIYEPESSASLGFGFRCGFLGLLHMEIVQERLEREFDLNLVLSTPSVIYEVKTRKGEKVMVDNPMKLPPTELIDEVEEPYVRAFIIIPPDSMGAVLELCESKRGIYFSTEYMSEDRAKIIYEFPLAEILVDFYDKLKSLTRGYGSLDYEFVGYLPADIIKLDILINGKPFDALSCLVHRDKADYKGRAVVEKLKELIPRQLFEVIIQAAIGSRIIARGRVRPVGKHVTGKCYGGDITRKRKLWEKQKEGKKRLKQFGNVEIPQEAFFAAIKV